MKITSADVAAAMAELRDKSLKEIHAETAKIWLARGVAATRFADAADAADDEDLREAWLLDAEEYLHEALEHAALAVEGPLCAEVNVTVERVRAILDLAPDIPE